MKKEELLEIICGRLSDCLPEYEIEKISVSTNIQNNGVSAIGISIRLTGYYVVPCVYADRYLPEPDGQGEYDAAKIDIDALAGKLAEEFKYAMQNLAPEDDALYRKEKMEERIILALVNYQENAERLLECPYIMFHDLAVTFRWLVNCGERTGSVLITNQVLDAWNISTKTLWRLGIANTMRLFPPVIEKLDQVVKRMMEPASLKEELPESPFYFISNSRGTFGATVILYDGILEQVSSILGESFYILPSSINEVLAVPEHICREADILIEMVKDVNQCFVEQTEILSYSVYFYDKKEGCIRVITA